MIKDKNIHPRTPSRDESGRVETRQPPCPHPGRQAVIKPPQIISAHERVRLCGCVSYVIAGSFRLQDFRTWKMFLVYFLFLVSLVRPLTHKLVSFSWILFPMIVFLLFLFSVFTILSKELFFFDDLFSVCLIIFLEGDNFVKYIYFRLIF